MDETYKIIAGIASVFALYKIFVDVILARSSKRREEYDFTKTYIKDLEKNETHKFILEKGFFALTGNIYSINEIKTLLQYQEPSLAIERRSDAETFVKFDIEKLTYEWKGNYRRKLIRDTGRPVLMIFYVLFCSMAVFPYMLEPLSVFQGFTKAIVSLLLFSTSITCLSKHEKIGQAKKFMEMKKLSAK